MTKRNKVAIVKTLYVLPITMGMAGETRKENWIRILWSCCVPVCYVR